MILAGMVLATSAVFARTEPNSFLNNPANTHAALMKELSNDKEVMSRFMRHFGMTREQVLDFAQGLSASTLDQDGVYLVYNCNDQEEIRAKVIFYKKGTKVWKDSSGKPVMKMSCANPMVRGTDDQLAVVEQGPVAEPVENIRPLVPNSEPQPAEMENTILPAQNPETSPQDVPDSVIPVAAQVLTKSGGTNLGLIGGLAGVGLIAAKSTTGGGSSTTGGTSTTGGSCPPGSVVNSNGTCDPVPEPATFIILGAGAALFGARKRFKK